MKEHYLVSGSSGFIASALREHLEQLGRKVTALDRSGMILTPGDVIVDLAAYGNYFDQKDVTQTYEVNIMRLLRMLECAEAFPYKAFVVVGTSSEYGKRDAYMDESMIPKPDTFYAASKTGAVMLARAWAKERKRPIVAIRPFSVTGPGEQSRHLIPT